jgi:3-oxoacyl-[acyl-carrier-protein] synthase-1
MRKVFAGHSSVITALGFTAEENYSALFRGECAITGEVFHDLPATTARIRDSRIDDAYAARGVSPHTTRLEKLFILSIADSLERSKINTKSERTALVISTTKGNVGELSRRDDPESRVKLQDMADFIGQSLSFVRRPWVISNACISGLSAIACAKELIASGMIDHAVVSGGDVITDFVLSGFLSFRAISDIPCAPFDADRRGLSLGEGCASIVLTSDRSVIGNEPVIEVAGCATSNDANHISGPSRDGSGLYLAVKKAMEGARVSSRDITSVSAHGTGTAYNDEMESKAFTLASLQDVPLYSLKGSIGHTLGAAGVIESVIAAESVRRKEIIASKGYVKCGVPMPLNVCMSSGALENSVCLKTASGFGGCNAAIVFAEADR